MRQEQDLMDDLLISEKQLCSTYSTAVTESPTPNIRSNFENALTNTFTTQNEVYKAMSSKGWYQTDPAQANKIVEAKTKYSQKPNLM